MTAMAPMPLDFSVQVRSRTESEPERSLTPPVNDRIIGPVGNDTPTTSSAFRVVTPKGRPEGNYSKHYNQTSTCINTNHWIRL